MAVVWKQLQQLQIHVIITLPVFQVHRYIILIDRSRRVFLRRLEVLAEGEADAIRLTSNGVKLAIDKLLLIIDD